MRVACLALFLTLPAAFAHELTTPVIAPAFAVLEAPLAASNGRNFLTIWTANGHVYGSVADGTSEPPAAITLLPHGGRPAALIAAGDDYVAALSTPNGGVQLVWVDDVGRVLSVAQPDLPPLYDPRIAWNGQYLLLIGADGEVRSPDYQPLRIRAYLLTREGVLYRAIGTVAAGMTFAAAADRGEYSVTIGSREGLRLYRIGTGGESGNNFVQMYVTKSSYELWPGSIQIAVRGTTTAVSWITAEPNPTATLAFIEDGSVAHREINPVNATRLVATSTGYVTAGQSGRDVLLVRFDSEGRQVGKRLIPNVRFADIAAAGDVIEFAYTEGAKLLAAWLPDDSAGPPVLTAILSKAPIYQSRPAVASDGIEFFAAFAEYAAGTTSARYARFARNGHGLDGAGRPLGETYVGENYSYILAAAAFGAGRYLVAWSDSPSADTGRTRAAFVGADGSIGEPFFVRENAGEPAVIWNGSGFFLVWTQYQTPYKGRIFGATISPSGSVSAPRQISPPPPGTVHESHLAGDVAWNGREYLVAWSVNDFNGNICSACSPPLPAGVHAIRVNADGVPREWTSMKIVPLSRSGELPVSGVHVAAAGQQFLVLIDRYERVDSSLVHALGFEAPRPFFQWLSRNQNSVIGVISDVTADRDGFMTAVRFGDEKRSWIATRRLSAWASSSEPARGVEVGWPDWSWKQALAAAANAVGDTAIVDAESLHPGDVPRIHARLVSEMPLLPAPPAPPRNVTAKTVGPQTTISWEGSDGAEGYAIEYVSSPTRTYRLATIGAETRTYTANLIVRLPIRVRAYNGGGLSEPSAEIVPLDVTRHRAVHR